LADKIGPQFSMRVLVDLLMLPFWRPWHMLVPLVLVFGAATAASFVLRERYRSTTVILVERAQIPDSMVPELVTQNSRDQLATLRQEILSRTRLERLLEELHPYPELEKRKSSLELVDTMRASINVRVRGSDAFSIDFSHHSPSTAQAVTERLASLFIDEASQSRSRQVEDASAFILEELETARKELEEQEVALRRFKERYMGSLPEQLNSNLATLQRLQLEQQATEQSLQAARQRQVELQMSIANRAYAGTADAGAVVDPGTELVKLQRDLEALRARYTEKHPDVIALEGRVARLKEQVARAGDAAAPGEDALAATIRAQVREAELDVRRLEERLVEQQARIGEFQHRVDQTPRTEQELASLTRDNIELRENYSALLKRKLDAEMAGSLERRWKGEQFRILDPANLPDRPYFPPRGLMILAGLLLGLVAGYGVCLATETLGESVKTVEELEALLPFPVLASIPYAHLPRRTPVLANGRDGLA